MSHPVASCRSTQQQRAGGEQRIGMRLGDGADQCHAGDRRLREVEVVRFVDIFPVRGIVDANGGVIDRGVHGRRIGPRDVFDPQLLSTKIEPAGRAVREAGDATLDKWTVAAGRPIDTAHGQLRHLGQRDGAVAIDIDAGKRAADRMRRVEIRLRGVIDVKTGPRESPLRRGFCLGGLAACCQYGSTNKLFQHEQLSVTPR